MTDNDEGQLGFDRANGDSRSSITEDRLVESIYKQLMESLCQDVAVNMHELIKTGADDVIPSSWKLFSGSTVPSRRDLYPELYNGGETKEEEKPNGDENDTKAELEPKRRISDSEIDALLDKYAVNLPNESATKAGTKRRKRDIAEEEEKLLLLSKIQKEKESNYKDSDDEEGDDNTNDDDDDDDEDFKMEDAEDDDDGSQEKKKKRGRSLSTSSAPEDSKGQPEASETTTTQKENTSNKLDIWGKNPAKEPKNRLCRCQICGRLISTSRFANHLDKCMGLSTSRGAGGTSSSGSSLMAPALSMGAMGTKKRSIGTR